MATHEYYEEEFDDWATLAGDDPEAFERMRLALIDQFISDAPPERRDRLHRLQWRIEQERARSGSPLGACIRLTRMMWSSVLDRGGLLDHLQQLSGILQENPATQTTARILPFPSREVGR